MGGHILRKAHDELTCQSWNLTAAMADAQCCRFNCEKNSIPKIHGFWHVALVEEGQEAWKEIVDSQLNQLSNSRLVCSSDKITIVAVGREENVEKYFRHLSHPYQVIFAGEDTTQWEFPTLGLLQKYCFDNPESLGGFVAVDPVTQRSVEYLGQPG